MKLVLFEGSGMPAGYGLVTSNGVVSLAHLIPVGDTPQDTLRQLIDSVAALRPRLEVLATTADAIPLEGVRLLPTVPRPGKILLTTAVYRPDAASDAKQLLATLKSPESVVGPGDMVRLPDVDASWQFVPHAMLGLVIRGPAKNVAARDWRNAVFGYTCVIDVMALGDEQFGRDFWLAKADTLGPLGPCIVTSDELSDPSGLRVRSWQNGTLAQDFLIADASHSIGQQVEFATTVMTLHSGDILACGTAALGARPLADQDAVEVEIEPIGRLAVTVAAAIGSTA